MAKTPLNCDTNSPNVTKTENKLSTIQSIIASISVSLTSPLFMAKTQYYNMSFTYHKTVTFTCFIV